MMNAPQTIMFYDGGCPLCSREVNHYRRLDRSHRVQWVDMTQNPTLPQAFGISYQTAMERLHVLHRDGRMLSGAYAFAAIWSELPYYRVLAKIVRFPGILAALDGAYRLFARWRYRRRCEDGVCSVAPGH
jgi:predicted DCC family thiol-disulfide oxidoreductase YuxK